MFYSVLEGPPYDIQVEDGEEEGRIVIVVLAKHFDGRVVSVLSGLVETEIGGMQQWEFSFSIEVFSEGELFEHFSTQDRNIAANYIPLGIRALVMDVVCASLRALIEDANPAMTYWVTKDLNPPEKGLAKHHMLRETLENMGYTCAEEGTDAFGRRFWSMRR